METGALTPEEQDGLNKIDSAHNIIFDHWNHDTQKFIHPEQIAMEKEEAEEARIARDGPGKKFTVPDWLVDDWTGTRFAENILCYGKSPCPAAPIDYPKKAEDSALTLLDPLNPGSDPMDPNLSDVQKIMDRYAQKDKEAEEKKDEPKQDDAKFTQGLEINEEDKDQVDKIFERYAQSDARKSYEEHMQFMLDGDSESKK